jgi:hypothetical protein
VQVDVFFGMPTDLFLACQVIFLAKACSCSLIQHVRFNLSTGGLGLDFASAQGLDFASTCPLILSDIVRLFFGYSFPRWHFSDQSPKTIFYFDPMPFVFSEHVLLAGSNPDGMCVVTCGIVADVSQSLLVRSMEGLPPFSKTLSVQLPTKLVFFFHLCKREKSISVLTSAMVRMTLRCGHNPGSSNTLTLVPSRGSLTIHWIPSQSCGGTRPLPTLNPLALALLTVWASYQSRRYFR